MSKPSVSVIITVKNVERTLRACLDSLAKLDYPDYEVILVNDGSTDGTALILSSYPRVKVINTSGIGPAAARNLALKEAQGEFVAFTDGDCTVKQDWLKELTGSFTAPLIAGSGGIQGTNNDETYFGKKIQKLFVKFGLVSEYINTGKGIIYTKHNPSCNAMYRKSVLGEVGGFAEGLFPCEDLELDRRIRRKGYKLVFNPEAVVLHYRPRDIKSFLNMMHRYGLAHARLLMKHHVFSRFLYAPVISLIFLFLFFILFSFNHALGLGFALVILLAVILYLSCDLLVLYLALRGFIAWVWGFIRGVLI